MRLSEFCRAYRVEIAETLTGVNPAVRTEFAHLECIDHHGE
jgi:hypothetical protein